MVMMRAGARDADLSSRMLKMMGAVPSRAMTPQIPRPT
jgi:hypothetical protein